MSAMNVPLLDLKLQYAQLKEEIEPVMRKVAEDQWFIMGPEVKALEEEIAQYTGAKFAIGCASGSDALLLALMALNIDGIRSGSRPKVVCPSYTFFATGGSAWRLGIDPVFADIDPVTYNMDIEHTKQLLDQHPDIKAIMPVHLFGQSIDMDEWTKLAEERNLPLIEDAAQSLGTKDDQGITVGSRGTIGCFSFFPSKNLGAFGDAGAVTTNDPELAEKLSILRVHGGKPKYYHRMVGVNSRLDALQAAILRIKLTHLESWHEQRIQNAANYDQMFQSQGALTNETPIAQEADLQIRTPKGVTGKARHIYNQYVIRVPGEIRDDLRKHLSENNIGNEVYYPVPLHMQECFAELGGKEGDLPHSELAAKETIALPIYPGLTQEQQQYVADTVVSFVRAHTPTSV